MTARQAPEADAATDPKSVGAQAARPAAAVEGPRGARAIDDDLADIEAILKKRGIT